MRNIKIIIYKALVMIFISSFYGCPIDPDGDSTITIRNNSDKTIDFYFAEDSVIVRQPFRKPKDRVLLPWGEFTSSAWWLKDLNKYGVLYLLIFDVDVLNTVQWDTIRKYNMYLKRFDFTKTILDSLNWTLTYP